MDATAKDMAGYFVGKDAFVNERFAIPREGLTLGRDPKAASRVLDHPMVSRAHVKVDVDKDGNVVIRDLGSTNGTFLNGKKLMGTAILADGDKVTLDEAGKLLLVFEPMPTAGTEEGVAQTVAPRPDTTPAPGPTTVSSLDPATTPSPGPAATPAPTVIEPEWVDSRKWLAEALKAEGKEAPSSAIPRVPATSLKELAEADLPIYDEAQRIFERLIGDGRKELEPQLAALLTDQAVLCDSVEKVSEAVSLVSRAIGIYERLVEVSVKPEVANDLATACSNKAGMIWRTGDYQAALSLCDHAIEIREWLVDHEGKEDLRGDLARAKVKRAVVYLNLGNASVARTEGRDAVAMLKKEADKTGREDLRAELEWATETLKKLL